MYSLQSIIKKLLSKFIKIPTALTIVKVFDCNYCETFDKRIINDKTIAKTKYKKYS